MLNTQFKHNETDDCHGNTLTLHDCIAEKVTFCDGILRFYLPNGFWITPEHDENILDKTVRTDAAVVDFLISDSDEISVDMFKKSLFNKTMVESWEINDLIDAINKGDFSLEFVYQYRANFEQLWQCVIHTKKELYYMECQLHLPEAQATFRWNNLRPDQEW